MTPKSESNIAVLLACHNRREKTIECLRSLGRQHLSGDIRQSVTLLDDGSSDGTAEAVLLEFPEATILRGDGSLFWCGGMRLAWSSAAISNPDYFLLLNDDTLLDENALQTLLGICDSPEARTIAVAAIRDPHTGAHTYGGVLGSNERIPVSGALESCDTLNANAVLITRAVHREVGGFHDAYTHAMGDFDYGYMATRSGIRIIQSAESLGTCPRNPSHGTWRDRSLGRRQRYRKLQSPKGLPWKEWVTYNRRNAGWIWPWRCISPYVRILLGR